MASIGVSRRLLSIQAVTPGLFKRRSVLCWCRLMFILIFVCATAHSARSQSLFCVVSPSSSTCPTISEGGVTVSGFSASGTFPLQYEAFSSYIGAPNGALVMDFTINVCTHDPSFPPNSLIPCSGVGPVHQQISFTATPSPQLDVFGGSAAICTPSTYFTITVNAGGKIAATTACPGSFLPISMSPFPGGNVVIGIDANGDVYAPGLSVDIVNPPPAAAPLSITTSSLPSGTVGSTYTQANSSPASLTATGGTPPYTWSIVSGSGALPDGLALSLSSGVITGTPTTAGTFTFTAQVKDSTGATAPSGSLSIQIGNLSPPTNLKAIQVGTDGKQIAVTWEYGSDPVDGFIIQSSFPAIPFDTLTTVTAASVCGPSPDTAYTLFCTYSDLNVPPFLTKSYQISAYRGSTANASSYSSPATAYQLKKCVQAWLNSGGTPRTDCVNAPIDRAPGTWIQADFTPDTGLPSVHAAAQALPADPSRPRFDHFNWLQYVEHWPQCYLNLPDSIPSPAGKLHTAILGPTGLPDQGTPVSMVGQVDPPLGGIYEYWVDGKSLADNLPFYFNEQQIWYLSSPNSPISLGFSISGQTAGGDQSQVQTATFYDQPQQPCLPGTPPDNEGFLTFLVGVASPVGFLPPSYVVLNGFSWYTTFNGFLPPSGGIVVSSDKPPRTGTGGSGGIFNVADVDVSNLPPSIRQQLVRDGAQNISAAPYVDRSAPLTAAFLSGPLGANGWYTDPVQVTLIATDIDGPSDIASTTYTVNGGSLAAYASPFTISADGVHTIQFGSVDVAGNVETPRPTQTIKLDATPPSITVSAKILASRHEEDHRIVHVAISGRITDLTSGVAPSTAAFNVSNADGITQTSGSLTLSSDGTYSLTVSFRRTRHHDDEDGDERKLYKVTVSAKDNAGNQGSASTLVSLDRDKRDDDHNE